jgi:hypothetical protein
MDGSACEQTGFIKKVGAAIRRLSLKGKEKMLESPPEGSRPAAIIWDRNGANRPVNQESH